jgi:hypothetical protein
MRAVGVTAVLSTFLVVLLSTGCGSRRSLSPNQTRPTNAGQLKTISLREATLLVKAQVGGNVSCGAVELGKDGRAVYPCAVTSGTEKLACLVPQLFSQGGATRFPTAPDGPAVLCSPGRGYQRPVIPSPKKNV